MRKYQTFKPTASKTWNAKLSKRKVTDFCDLILTFRARNVFFTLSQRGKTVLTKSCGMQGFKNLLKKTPVAAEETMSSFVQDMTELGVSRLRLLLKGFNRVRPTVLRKFTSIGRRFTVQNVIDDTMVPFGGCRPRAMKSRRRRLRGTSQQKVSTYVRGKSRTR